MPLAALIALGHPCRRNTSAFVPSAREWYSKVT